MGASGLQPLQRLKSMRAASCKPIFCSDARDAMSLSAFRAFALDCTRGARLFNAATRVLAVHSVQSTARMEIRRPALPEESWERARALLCAKRITRFASSSHFCLDCSGCQTARASIQNRSALVIARQTYRGRQLQTLGCIARAHVEYPLPQSSCSSRAARRKAPPTRAHK